MYLESVFSILWSCEKKIVTRKPVQCLAQLFVFCLNRNRVHASLDCFVDFMFAFLNSSDNQMTNGAEFSLVSVFGVRVRFQGQSWEIVKKPLRQECIPAQEI